MFNRTQILIDLERDEGLRLVPYDDATGKAFQRGDTLKGNLTNGIGWNMQGLPLTETQARTILGWHVDDVAAALYVALPWLGNMTEARQRAIAEMAFNLGVEGLLKFDTFLDFVGRGKYPEAALDLKGTVWAKQVGQRAARIAQMILQG